MTIGSFLFLNPRLVTRWPNRASDVCYLAYKDEPEILCGDLPQNRWTFLGTWFLSPERHALEWCCFVTVALIVLKIVGPRLKWDDSKARGSSEDASRDGPFQPRRWMQISTLMFYPYVAWTKLHWSNSNYPMRWLLFVGMPVGTLWIMSALFNLALPFAPISASRRHYLLQVWLSFLPSLLPVFEALFGTISWIVTHGGKNVWDTVYNVMYISHVVYLGFVPVYYIIFEGDLTMFPPRPQSVGPMRYAFSVVKDGILWQIAGNATACLYYFGIMTPLSIYAGLNVFGMLTPNHSNAGADFRLRDMSRWFAHGCMLRGILCLLELLIFVLSKKANAYLPFRRRNNEKHQE